MDPWFIDQNLDIPDWDTKSAIKPAEAAFLFDFVKEHKLRNTLEIGFAFARSASHIMAASGSIHTACDPFQERYGNYGLKNLEKLGLLERLNFIPDFSHNALPHLLREGRKFDFVFIDGDHKFDGILLDFYYSDLLLEQGGYIIFHDAWMRASRLVEGFIRSNRKEYSIIKSPQSNLLVVQKNGEDHRDGMFFKEFYTTRGLLRQPLITWMYSGKPSATKDMIRRLRNLFR